MADNPFQSDIEWSEEGVKHKQEFLNSLAFLYARTFDGAPEASLMELPGEMDEWSTKLVVNLRKGLDSIEQDILKSQKFHGAVATIHSLVNILKRATQDATTPDQTKAVQYALQQFLKPLSLFAPHLAESLWQNSTGTKNSIFSELWPQINFAVNDNAGVCAIPVLINGRPQRNKTLSRLRRKRTTRQEEKLCT